MDKLALFFKYLSFLLKSGNEHSIHSPFVFELYTKAIKPRKGFYIYSSIEKLRKELHASNKEILIEDYGAGSKIVKSNKRKIRDIARNSEKSPALAQLIFRLIDHLKPNTILDLGTSLGITTIYEASVHKSANIYTFEGCQQTANVALENFKKLGVKNISLIPGNIDNTLPEQLKKLDQVDFVFFDANHRYEPTIRYFKLCMEKINENSFFIFDDIHWSDEMEKAWKEIIEHPEVSLSIDLFFLGIVFFRKKQPKQHFVLRH